MQWQNLASRCIPWKSTGHSNAAQQHSSQQICNRIAAVLFKMYFDQLHCLQRFEKWNVSGLNKVPAFRPKRGGNQVEPLDSLVGSSTLGSFVVCP